MIFNESLSYKDRLGTNPKNSKDIPITPPRRSDRTTRSTDIFSIVALYSIYYRWEPKSYNEALLVDESIKWELAIRMI